MMTMRRTVAGKAVEDGEETGKARVVSLLRVEEKVLEV